MTMRRAPRRYLGLACCAALVLSLSGCDYWPPALQAQIEQLRSEIQVVTAENTQLQSEISELSRTRQDLQTQFDELSRVNQEKSHMITDLRRQIDTSRAKTAKAQTRLKKTAKATATSSSKQTIKKKASTKR